MIFLEPEKKQRNCKRTDWMFVRKRQFQQKNYTNNAINRWRNFHDEYFYFICVIVDTCLTYKSELTELFMKWFEERQNSRSEWEIQSVDSHTYTATTGKKQQQRMHAHTNSERGRDIKLNIRASETRIASSEFSAFVIQYNLKAHVYARLTQKWRQQQEQQ